MEGDADILRESSPLPTCPVACVTCHMSPVMCHMSLHIIHFFCGEASRSRFCYHWGLPSPVLNRRGVARVFYKKPYFSFTDSFSDPFPPNLVVYTTRLLIFNNLQLTGNFEFLVSFYPRNCHWWLFLWMSNFADKKYPTLKNCFLRRGTCQKGKI